MAARLAIAFCAWLLRRYGVEWHLGPETSAHTMRDKRGRFRPKDGGGYGLPRDIPHHVADLMWDMGVTTEMYESAPVALVLPADVEDIDALERGLREWIAHNMDHWINGRRYSLYSVFNALKYTYAINYYFYKPPKKWIGRWVSHYQSDADVHHKRDCSLIDAPPHSGSWQNTYPSKLSTPEGSAQSGTDASQGAERPCSSFNPVLCDPQFFSQADRTAAMQEGSEALGSTAGGRKALPYAVRGDPLRGPPDPYPTHLHIDNLITTRKRLTAWNSSRRNGRNQATRAGVRRLAAAATVSNSLVHDSEERPAGRLWSDAWQRVVL